MVLIFEIISTMTMEELLTQLSKKAKVECEEAQRQIIAASNGLAGVHIIRGEVRTCSTILDFVADWIKFNFDVRPALRLKFQLNLEMPSQCVVRGGALVETMTFNRWVDSRSSHHVGTLGKSFTCSCLCAS